MSLRYPLLLPLLLIVVLALPSVSASPEGLQATAGEGYVDLSWQPVAGAEGYVLYRGSAEGMTAVANLSAPFTAYHDAGLDGGEAFIYYVTALEGGNESAPGNAVSVTVLSKEEGNVVLPILAIVISLIAIQVCIVMLLYFSKSKMQLK